MRKTSNTLTTHKPIIGPLVGESEMAKNSFRKILNVKIMSKIFFYLNMKTAQTTPKHEKQDMWDPC